MKPAALTTLVITLILMVSACSALQGNPLESDAFKTMVAGTVQAEVAKAARQASYASETPQPDATAPNPLPAANTGLILQAGNCFDLDTSTLLSAGDTSCDFELQGNQIDPVNRCWFTGYVGDTTPSRYLCQAEIYSEQSFASVVGEYVCFSTNQGIPGFLIPRGNGAGSITFDLWLFK